MKTALLLTLIIFSTDFAQSLSSDGNIIMGDERGSEIEQTSPTLGKEELKAIAEKLFLANNLVSERYEYSSNLSLGLYFIRYLGEIGTYSLGASDLEQLILAVENLYGSPLNETLKNLLQSIKALHFTKKEKSIYLKIETKNKKKISVPIDVEREGIVSSINTFYLENNSSFSVWDINTDGKKKKYFRLLAKKKEVFQLPKVHLISQEYIEALRKYLASEMSITPVAGKVKGMGFNVSLSRWFPKTLRTMNFKVGEIGSFLGLKNSRDEDLPSFWLSAKKWGLHIVSTIDD
tara:strand:- start:250 stop:1122 length:873 start_codon:yes stop_codon:yes gene_type:complete